ncbi:MAG: hypothetical protein OXF66_10440 [Gammaproteobacteria bacterium]|nr:hypothetical protein [Gammaproteobacteria bacterium]MCY4255166.1 hypothetical protein [Gammaproteobacteria bacterium]
MILGEALERLLQDVTAPFVTELFLYLLLILFVTALWCLRKNRAARFTSLAPTLLTSVGILGTFVGVVVGLLDFDSTPDRLQESTGELLDGLKTAFVSSIAGMFGGVLFRLFSFTSWMQPEQQGYSDDVSVGDLLGALREQSQLLEAVRDVIGGTEESSLAGQIKLFRTDMADMHRENRTARTELLGELRVGLDKFADQLSKSATEQVIQALEQVIRQFNENLTEQFGDNFKALNASVQKLVEWQENYREQLQQLHQLYEQSAKSITTIEAATAKVAESSASITDSMAGLTPIIQTANHQITELGQHLEAFQELRNKAVEALPQVQEYAKKMTDDMAAMVNALGERQRELLIQSESYAEQQGQSALQLLESQQDVVQQAENSFSEIGSVIQSAASEAQQRVVETSQKASDAMQGALNGIAETQERVTRESMESLVSQLKEASSRTAEQVNRQMQTQSEAMGKEVERVLQELGQYLGQISGKFVEDYQKYAEAMENFVRETKTPYSRGPNNP